MTGRERIQAAFEFQPTDRVPIFEQTVASKVASEAFGRPLDIGGGDLRYKEAVASLAGEQAHREFVVKMLGDIAWLYRQMGFDMIRMPWREKRTPARKIDESTYFFGSEDATWSLVRYSQQAGSWHEVDNHLRRGGVDVLVPEIRSAVESFDGPKPPSDDELADWDELCRLAGPDLCRACGCGGVGVLMYEPAWLEAMVLYPDLVGEYLSHRCEEQLLAIEVYQQHGAEVCLAGGDLAMNTGPAYSPAMFRRLVLPHLKRITAKCHELQMRYIFRTDGWTWPIADMLFEESGVDGYGEIDRQAGMKLDELRARFGRLCLFGNVDCADVLTRGTVDDVRRATEQNLTETGGLGHVLGSSNSIVFETPPANLLAMFETARNWCR
jgi:uroporphyrinogen decarboxylase